MSANNNDDFDLIEHLIELEYRVCVYEMILNEIINHLQIKINTGKFDKIKTQALDILQKKYPNLHIKTGEFN